MKLVKILLFALLIWGCDSTYDDFQKINRKPDISFTFIENDVRQIQDSVKFSSSTRNPYIQNYTVVDEDNNLKEVYFNLISGNGSVRTYGNFTLRRLEKNIDGIYQLQFLPKGLGFNQIEVVAVDYLDQESSVIVDLTSFENLQPVANISVKPKRVLSRYEWTIDASESFDTDQPYGGGISKYRYSINSTVINWDKPTLDYNFPEKNLYAIGVQVMDNDGVWSRKVEQIYPID